MNTTSRKPESVSSVNMTPLAAKVGAHHVLDAGRQRDLIVSEALVHAIGDGAIVEQRGEHFVHALQQRIAAAHVEERFLLAGERGIRQIFGGRGGAYRDGNVAPAAHALERFEDLALEPRRERRGQDPLADLRADARERFDVIDVERRQLLGDALGETFVLQEVPIGLRRGRKAAGHVDAGLREVADHLAERGVLAADSLDVVPAELLEGNGVGAQVDALSISEVLLLIPAPVR